MLLSAELPWLMTTLLVSLRLGVVMLMTPVFAALGLPLRVRVLLVLALSAMLVSGMAPAIVTAAATSAAGKLALAAANELLLGGLLAFGLFAGFAAFQFAGRIMDIQMGFGVAGLLDPATRNHAPLLGMILNLTAVLTFFAIGGHHLLLRGLAFSLERIPPGSSLSAFPIATVIEQFGAMFVYAALLAAPVMTVILLVDIGMAMMARTMPQMNVFIIGLPLKIFVGLAILAISLGFIGPAFARVFDGLFTGWQKIITH
jgi:flagellar biosynthesis protein FliR